MAVCTSLLHVPPLCRHGGAHVAAALAEQGACFALRHLSDAQQRGHTELAALILSKPPLRP